MLNVKNVLLANGKMSHFKEYATAAAAALCFDEILQILPSIHSVAPTFSSQPRHHRHYHNRVVVVIIIQLPFRGSMKKVPLSKPLLQGYRGTYVRTYLVFKQIQTFP